MPPDMEEDGGDDEEGRFFGGGITQDTADVLNFIEERDQEGFGVRLHL
jgi:beta-catenin-like protein 1